MPQSLRGKPSRDQQIGTSARTAQSTAPSPAQGTAPSSAQRTISSSCAKARRAHPEPQFQKGLPSTRMSARARTRGEFERLCNSRQPRPVRNTDPPKGRKSSSANLLRPSSRKNAHYLAAARARLPILPAAHLTPGKSGLTYSSRIVFRPAPSPLPFSPLVEGSLRRRNDLFLPSAGPVMSEALIANSFCKGCPS